MLNLSICVVTYESPVVTDLFLMELIDSLKNHEDWEILVYDNSRTEVLMNSVFPKYHGNIKVWRDLSNPGFSFANNQLILRSSFDRVLLLNPDVFGFRESLWNKVELEKLDGRVKFIKLLNEDGSFQNCIGKYAGFKRAISKKINYSMIDTIVPIEMGIMAFMLTDKSVFSRVGLLDSDYPLYAEDMDWCYRANKVNIPVLYDPSYILTHIGGASSNEKNEKRKVRLKKLNAEKIFINKHYHGVNYFLSMFFYSIKRLLVHGF